MRLTLAPSLGPGIHRSALRRLMAGLSIAAALAAAACGSASSRPSSTARRSTARPSSSTTATASGPASGAATSSATSTTALPGTGKPAITIGDKNYTEQFVLGELYLQALEAQGFTVQLNRNIGPTDVTLQALQTGSLAMYPEYLNVFDSAVAHSARAFHSQGAAYAAARRYAAAHGLALLAATPFSDTVTLGVTVGYAQANEVRSLPDLTRLSPPVTIGGPPQFQTGQPGLATVEQAYGLRPSAFTNLDVGAQYAALDDGSVQAAYMETTDGQLASGDYAALRDPAHVFGWGNVVPVAAASVMAAEGPVFAATIDRVSSLLTTAVMRRLNQAVDIAQQDPATVATQFLETHGLIAPVTP